MTTSLNYHYSRAACGRFGITTNEFLSGTHYYACTWVERDNGCGQNALSRAQGHAPYTHRVGFEPTYTNQGHEQLYTTVLPL